MTKPHALGSPVGAPLLRTKRYLSVPEVAALMGQPQRTVRHWCATGQIPAHQGIKRGRYLIPMSTLRERHALSDAALEDEGETG